MLPAPETARACTDPSGRRLLFRYTGREASEFEQRAFERHMLECDLCYEDFLAVWRVGEIVESWSDDSAESSVLPLDSDSQTVLPEGAPEPTASGRLHVLRWLATGLIIGLALGTCL